MERQSRHAKPGIIVISKPPVTIFDRSELTYLSIRMMHYRVVNFVL